MPPPFSSPLQPAPHYWPGAVEQLDAQGRPINNVPPQAIAVDGNGNPIFLNDNELTKKNKFINGKVEALWADAVQNVRARTRPTLSCRPQERALNAFLPQPQDRALVLDELLHPLPPHPHPFLSTTQFTPTLAPPPCPPATERPD